MYYYLFINNVKINVQLKTSCVGTLICTLCTRVYHVSWLFAVNHWSTTKPGLTVIKHLVLTKNSSIQNVISNKTSTLIWLFWSTGFIFVLKSFMNVRRNLYNFLVILLKASDCFLTPSKQFSVISCLQQVQYFFVRWCMFEQDIKYM